MDKPLAKEVDAFILAHMPSTKIHLIQASPEDWGLLCFAALDAGLQRLRKRGVIAWKRKGYVIVWHKIDG
jgi:hypothetical protein